MWYDLEALGLEFASFQYQYRTMAPYFGLRGPSLNRAIMWLVVCPAFVTYGYNQGVMGGLLTLESFVETFPQMNTLTATEAEKTYNSTIQGKLSHYIRGVDRPPMICISTAWLLSHTIFVQARSSHYIPLVEYLVRYHAFNSVTGSAAGRLSCSPLSSQ